MKKALTACFILMVCVCFFAVPALASDGGIFKVSAPGKIYFSEECVQQRKDAEFTVDMKLTKSADIDILYSHDDWEHTYKHSAYVKGGAWNGVTVDISDVPKGVHKNLK